MLNRSERRRMEKNIASYNAKKTFTKQEVEALNSQSYDFGLNHALEALKRVYGLGPKRLGKIIEVVRELQDKDFGNHARAIQNLEEMKYRRAIRLNNDAINKGENK